MLDWSSLSFASLHLSSHILHPSKCACDFHEQLVQLGCITLFGSGVAKVLRQ